MFGTGFGSKKARAVLAGGVVFCMMSSLVAQIRSEERTIQRSQGNLQALLKSSFVAVGGQIEKTSISPNVYRSYGASPLYLSSLAMNSISSSGVPGVRAILSLE